MDSAIAKPGPDSRLIRASIVSLAIASTLYFGAIVWSGRTAAWATFARIGEVTIVVGMLVAASGYLFRFARWQFALHRLGHSVPAGYSLRVYLAGLALTASPGKLGETVRSLLLLSRGVTPADSLGSFLADRLSDVLGICILAAFPLLLVGRDPTFILILGSAIVLAAALVRRVALKPDLPLPLPVARALMRFPAVARIGRGALRSWAYLWSTPRVAVFSLAAVVAYGLQGLVFWGFCNAAGFPIDAAVAIAIFALATLFGAASMLPGGLGAMEAALVYQLTAEGAAEPVAVAVAIATRVATLWLGIAIGIGAFASVAVDRTRRS